MRLGWSVLCKDFEEHDDGTLTLIEVFADAALEISTPSPVPSNVSFDPPVLLISYWFSESDLDQKRYPALLRVLAPADNQILVEWNFAIDLLFSSSRLVIFHLDQLMFVGDGLYELHIEILEFGEWDIRSQNSLQVKSTVS